MIPNIIHYVWIDKSDNEYGMLPYVYEICVASCILKNCVNFRIIMHSNKPMIYRFDRVGESIESDILDKSVFEEIDRLGISGITHKSDFIRYSLLNDIGGIYIDTDIIILENLKNLLDKDFVMAKQSRDMYCSGVIASRPGHKLISDTLQTYYDDYHADKWAYNAMRVISENIASFDDATTLNIDEGFHYPLYTNLSKFYEENPIGFEKVLGHHLWSSSPNGKKLIKYIEENIVGSETSYIIKLCNDIVERIWH